MPEPLNIKKATAEIDELGMKNWLIKEFTISFREARKNKLNTFNEHSYDVNWIENILNLTEAVLENYYEPSSSISFVIFEPMIREIFAAPFVDRVVHHFLYRMQCGWWDRRFLPDSYSCREEKGTLYAIQRAQKMMQRVTNNYTEKAYIIKLDIRGYFMSLPRYKLFQRVKWGLNRQFSPYRNLPSAHELYKVCLFLWHQILFDDPVKKSRRRGPLDNWDVLPSEKSLYTRDYGLGIVIGNLTSQLVSNIYLDQLDRFIRFELGYKHYGRYVDDFFIMVEEKNYEKAKADIKLIDNFLTDKLQLTLHPKKRYAGSVYHGMPFLGARIYPHCLYPSNRLQQKFSYLLYKMKYSKDPIKNESLISYFGYFIHLNADKYVEKVFKGYGIGYDLYLESKRADRRSWDDIIYDIRCDLQGKPRPNLKL